MLKLALGLLCVGVLATQASAAVLVYGDSMFGFNETPPNASTANGTALVMIDTVSNMLTVAESWTGLATPASGAHIHCCALPGASAQVALPFTAFPALTTGAYLQTFDLTLSGTYTSGFLSAGGGTASGAESLLLSSMAAGKTYTNIHDSVFPSGEIRGQLVALTPEPGSLALAGASLLGLLAMVRRRRRQ